MALLITVVMKSRGKLVIIILLLFLSLTASTEGFSYSLSIKTQQSWNPWYGYIDSDYSSQPIWDGDTVSDNFVSPVYDRVYGYEADSPGAPMRYGGIFTGDCWDPYECAFSFYANGTQIADVSGTWRSDLIGEMNLKLTGDDTIRGMYEINGTKGYIEGNFTSNGSDSMEGLWWEEPSYQPPFSAGIIKMTFPNESSLEGIFSYPDGTWGPFNATKENGNLSPGVEINLKNIPEVNWKVNQTEVKELRVSRNPEENPVLTPPKKKLSG